MENDFGKKPVSREHHVASDNKEEGANSVMRSDITNNSENKKEDFPGYPHYPSSEDILNPANNEGKVDIDVENLSQSDKVADLNFNQQPVETLNSDVEQPALPEMKDDESDIGIVAGTEADLTEDDLAVLGSLDQDMDLGEDEQIKSRS